MPSAFLHALYICLRKPKRKYSPRMSDASFRKSKTMLCMAKTYTASCKNSGPPNLNSDASNLNYMARSFCEMPRHKKKLDFYF